MAGAIAIATWEGGCLVGYGKATASIAENDASKRRVLSICGGFVEAFGSNVGRERHDDDCPDEAWGCC
jgi:hypothetical protein